MSDETKNSWESKWLKDDAGNVIGAEQSCTMTPKQAADFMESLRPKSGSGEPSRERQEFDKWFLSHKVSDGESENSREYWKAWQAATAQLRSSLEKAESELASAREEIERLKANEKFDASVLAETIRGYLESGMPGDLDSSVSPLALLQYNLGWWDGKHEPTRTLRLDSQHYRDGRNHPECGTSSEQGEA